MKTPHARSPIIRSNTPMEWGLSLLALSVLHFMVLGKIPAWITWAQEWKKMPPGSILAVGVASVAISLRAWDAAGKRRDK